MDMNRWQANKANELTGAKQNEAKMEWTGASKLLNGGKNLMRAVGMAGKKMAAGKHNLLNSNHRQHSRKTLRPQNFTIHRWGQKRYFKTLPFRDEAKNDISKRHYSQMGPKTIFQNVTIHRWGQKRYFKTLAFSDEA